MSTWDGKFALLPRQTFAKFSNGYILGFMLQEVCFQDEQDKFENTQFPVLVATTGL
jgi:hypothetical protein